MAQISHELLIGKHCQFCRSRRSRGPQVSHVIRDHSICLMSHRRYDRCAAGKYRFRHGLLIESPQILERASASSDNDHIHSELIESSDSLTYACRGLLSLDNGRIQYDLKVRIATKGDVDDILYCCAGRRCDDSEPFYIAGHGLFVHLVKHPRFLESSLEFLIPRIQDAGAVLDDPVSVKLIAAASLVNIHFTGYNDLIAFLHAKRKASSAPREHYAGKCARGIFQSEINMA